MEYIKPKESHNYYWHDDHFKNDLNLILAFVETDYIKDMHQQEFYEINIITRGNGVHYIEDNGIKTKVGDVFIIPPNVSHGYIGGEGFDVYHILISDYFMRKYSSDLQQLPNFFTLFAAEPIMRASTQQPLYLSPNNEQFVEIKRILDEMSIYNKLTDPISHISKSNLCMLFICTICKIYSENQESDNNLSINYDTSFMKSIAYIHENFSKKISIEDLCKIAYLTRSTYIRKFKKICKMPPALYIFKRKIEAAKNMLINTQYSIGEIAEKSGFYDIPHLTRSFENELGITPANYRKKHKE